MALDFIDLFEIVKCIKQLTSPLHVLSLGHPDILATPEAIAPLIGDRLLSIDNDRVRKERIGESREDCIGSAFGFFEALDATLYTLDKRELFGIDKMVDLNNPISGDSGEHVDKYDLVVDPGTSEHIFNIGQVLSTIVRATKVGGFVYHINPMVMINHGYWNFSPVAYKDFYTVNGFDIVMIKGRDKNGLFDVPYTTKYKPGPAAKLMIVCVARKIRAMRDIIWPMQEKYV